MIPIPKPVKSLPLKTQDINVWVDGVVTALDEGRLGVSALTSMLNMWLDEDGTLRPRQSLQLYGPQPTGNVISRLGRFSTNIGNAITHWLIIAQVVSDVTHIYIAKPEDDAWTEVTDPTQFAYDTSASIRFLQIAGKMLVMNGVNPLSFLDLSTVPSAPAMTGFDALDDPADAPTLTPSSGLSGDDFTVYYAYSYNSSVGETDPSPSGSANLTTDRSGWSGGQQVSVVVPTAPDGVESWNLYCATTSDGAGDPNLLLLQSGISPTQTTYADDGSISLTTIAPPNGNSTQGPQASRGVAIGGRAFLSGDSANPYNIAIGGDPGYELDFSPANGGSSLPVGAGSGELPTIVWNFRSGPGDPEIKCMTQDAGGVGKRYTIANNTITVEGLPITAWGATEDYGFNGTGAADSLLSYQDNTYYLASDGFYSSGTVPELQNLLHTQSVSQTLSLLNDFNSISQNALDKVDSCAWQQRLYWALPINSTENNQIWTLDLQRGGAWMKPWDIACQSMLLIQDNEAETHQLFLVNNQIMEATYEQFTNDNGVPFQTGAGTGVIAFSADQRTWAQVLKIVVVLLKAQGTVNFKVFGWTQDQKLEEVGSATFEGVVNTLGYGWNEEGWNNDSMTGWNNFTNVPTEQVPLSSDVPIPINRRLRYFLVQMNSTMAGVDFNVSNIIPLFVTVGLENLT